MEEESINPLDCWCPSVVDLILQHLSVVEWLELSKVSKDNFLFTKSYKKFLKNVVIRVKAPQKFKDKELIYFLANVTRKYENLELEGDAMIPKMQTIVKHQTTAWKRVKVSSMVFNGPTILQSFIDSTRNSIEELELSSIFVFNCDKKITLSLPLLNRLEMTECNDEEDTFFKRISFVISDCKSLEILKLVYSGVCEENQKKLLIDNGGLKVLELADVKDSFFHFFRTRRIFHLEKFTISFSTQDRFRLKPALNDFLFTQSSSLNTLELNGWISMDVIVTIYKMKSLKSLKVSQARQSLMRLNPAELDIRLEENSSINELILTDDLIDLPGVWQKLLKRAINLNRFQMFNSSFLH